MNITNKQNFIGTSQTFLENVFREWEPYRIHQIFNWVYHYGCRDFLEMTNLSKIIRAELSDRFYFSLPKIQNKYALVVDICGHVLFLPVK